MRRRSSTTSTTKTCSPHRVRTASVSAVFTPPLSPLRFTRPWSHLLSLPNEILYRIVITAAHKDKNSNKNTYTLNGDDKDGGAARLDYRALRNIALSCSRLHAFATAILYSTVSISDAKVARLFARTVVEAAHQGGIPLSPVEPRASSPRRTRERRHHALLQNGKSVDRLVLDYPFWYGEKTSHQRQASEYLQASMGAILGLGPSAPSLPSPMLSAIRTLLIDARILSHHASTLSSPPWAVANSVSPMPSEMVLSTYLRASTPFALPSLAAGLTHLVIAGSPSSWALPSATVSILGGLPSLTHVALPRKANANEDNDEEFAADVLAMITERAATPRALQCVVLVVETQAGITPAGMDGRSANDRLERYVETTNIWKRMSALARAVNDEVSYAKGRPLINVVPGQAGAWQRALTKSRVVEGVFDNNVFSSASRGRDLWRWAQEYECRRHLLIEMAQSNV